MSSVKPMPGHLLARVLPPPDTLFQVDTAIPMTRGEIVAVTECYEELVPGTIVFFQGGVAHSIAGEEHRVLAQGKVLLYECV